MRLGASESAAWRFVGGSAGVCSANALARLADVLCGVMESSVAAIVICCCNSALHRSKQGNAAGSARTARRGVEQTAHRPMCVREAAARFGARVRPCGCVCGEWTRFPSCDSQKAMYPCAKHTQKRKELARSSADGRAVHGRRCLHGLCHGSQWPWLTSPMQAASPEVARARRTLNRLHPLVSSGGANNSALLLSRPQLFLAMPTLHHSIAARRSMPAVRLLSVEACL